MIGTNLARSWKKEWYNLQQTYKGLFIIWSALGISRGSLLVRSHYVESIKDTRIPMCCKIIFTIIAILSAVFIIFKICCFLQKAMEGLGRERKILLYALPMFLILAVCLLTDASIANRPGYYIGDEKLISDEALQMYPFRFVYTSGLFLICYMMVPLVLAPSIMKIVFASYVFGYIIYRCREYYKKNYVYFLYMLFLLKPFLEHGIRVHRMQWYGFLYMLLAVKLYFDSKETTKLSLNIRVIFLMSFLISLLTIWRREGMYFLIWGGILLCVAYIFDSSGKCSKDKLKKRIWKLLVIFISTEILVCVPESIFELMQNHVADKNITYRAFFIHMYARDDFDRELCRDELEVIGTFLDLEKVESYNRDCGAEAYYECYWEWPAWRDRQYYCLADSFDGSRIHALNSAITGVIKKQPIVFLKSRWTTFRIIAQQTTSYNLFMPLILIIAVGICGCFRRDLIMILLTSGILGHTGITVMTMPASYFKYFYELFTCSYTLTAITIFNITYDCLKRREHCG